ncbi:hypothetical protein [Brevibacterium jeotgali]|nr:hypothetical protein [Brevibacterium jeotgali]
MNSTPDRQWSAPESFEPSRSGHTPHPGRTPTQPAPSMPDIRLVAGLGSLTLLYPILNIATDLLGVQALARLPLNSWLWLAIALTWILVVSLTRAAQPLLTLVFTGVAGGLFTAVLVIGIQLFTPGGPGLLTAPIAIVSIVAMNAVGGTVCGLIAWGLQSATAKRRSTP